ncbi:subtilisin-like protein [Lactarius hengduanensis]|nr:subtilisin-like protein [Lactarius hengduanensis]
MHYYHCIFVLSILATNLLGGLAKPLSPPWDVKHIKHSWNTVPRNWESLGRPPSGTTIDLYIALKPRRENALVDALYEVSEPGHPRYRAYLTKEQVAELVAPRPETLELVNSWLEHHAISSSSISMTHGGSALMLKGVSVTQANTLLGASYQLYRHVESGETIVRTVGYSLPVALHWHVLTVAPTTSFVSPRQWQTPRTRNRSDRAMNSTSGEPATMLSSRAKINSVTPSFLRWLYDTEAYIPNTHGENVLGVVGLLRDYPSPTDLTAFMQKYRSEAGDATFTVVDVNGGGGNIDIQYASAMAYPTPHIFYSTGQGPSGRENYFMSWLDYILAQENIPQTISLSYNNEEPSVSREYALYVCHQFAKLGVRGVSVILPSGNDGVGEGTCLRKDGTVRFRPTFPGTCPFVTVVGGTTDYEPEVAAAISGGGFSDYFERPSYQQEAVTTFFQDLGNRYQGLYKQRASGGRYKYSGARASLSPLSYLGRPSLSVQLTANLQVVAGIISLLNDWLIMTGQEPLGFLNPWLYGRGIRGLNDITEGSNPGCGTDGFSAIAGWDPVTGLGTPNFREMLEQLF